VARWLLLAAAMLVVAHVLVHLSWSIRRAVPPAWHDVFDLAHEHSLATWMTVGVWTMLGGVCALLGALGGRRSWYLLAAFFVYLSADDATMLHERVGWMGDAAVPTSTVYTWVVVLGPVLALCGVLIFRKLWIELADDPRGRLPLLLAFGALGFALLLELAEKPAVESGWRWRGFHAYRYTQTIEEACELFAPVLLLHVLLRRLEVEIRRRFQWRRAEDAEARTQFPPDFRDAA